MFPASAERTPMARRKKIYEGKAKILYEGPEPGTIVQYFKDDATAFNAEKKAVIEGKGVLNNRLSEYFMTGLNQIGVPTHFIKRLNMREQLVRQCEIIPLEIIVRRAACPNVWASKKARNCRVPLSNIATRTMRWGILW
jgi:phosphoribosylaminoimidazole-succinocarboxamide synthase